MTQLRIIAFNRIGIVFAICNFVSSIVIPKKTVGCEGIAEIVFRLGCFMNHELDSLLDAFPDNNPTQNATGLAIYYGYDVNSAFLSPIKVKSSSISAFSTLSATGVAGSFSAWALT
jgi:hypothetical protein